MAFLDKKAGGTGLGRCLLLIVIIAVLFHP
jgi:hypothetical protein